MLKYDADADADADADYGDGDAGGYDDANDDYTDDANYHYHYMMA